MKRTIFLLLTFVSLSHLYAQQADDQKLKLSGYIQSQFQWGEKDASLNVGSKNENTETSFNRIGIRRGRLKASYTRNITEGVFQVDITEKGIGIKDAYINLRDPWQGHTALRTGVFNRPFGHEIAYSSSLRESPERSAVFQTLFPEERDLGAMITLQPLKDMGWLNIKINAGLFAGNGIKQETDSRKDFIGHLLLSNSSNNNWGFGLGFSYYNGGVYQGNENVYTMQGNEFVLNNNQSNKGKYAKREYVGFNINFDSSPIIGDLKLSSEWIFGTQPGSHLSTKSPNSSSLPTGDTYIRNFTGGYVMLVQNIHTLPFTVVAKYDWYDPNTKVSGDDIGLNNTAQADIARSAIGLGLQWHINDNTRLQTYYDIVNNEETINISEYSKNLEDNMFTVRLQYKF